MMTPSSFSLTWAPFCRAAVMPRWASRPRGMSCSGWVPGHGWPRRSRHCRRASRKAKTLVVRSVAPGLRVERPASEYAFLVTALSEQNAERAVTARPPVEPSIARGHAKAHLFEQRSPLFPVDPILTQDRHPTRAPDRDSVNTLLPVKFAA